MKTPKDLIQLNFNDVAFFLGISTTDAKFKILDSYDLSEEDYDKYISEKTGVPKIGINDFVEKEKFEYKIKSCSILEGKNSIDYHVKVFNKGIPMSRIQEYGENKSFIKALKFTGKNNILNEILCKDQLFILQKCWVLKNTYQVKRWSEKCIEFIESNKWTFDYLSRYISLEIELEKQKELIKEDSN